MEAQPFPKYGAQQRLQEIATPRALWIIALGVITLAGLLAWSADRGLDITDEGSLLVGYSHPEETLNAPTHYWSIIGRSCAFLHPTVATYRLLRLGLLFLAVLVFSGGVYALYFGGRLRAPGERYPFFFLYFFVLGGALLSYSVNVRTLSYNSLNEIMLLTASGLLLGYGASRSGPAGLLLLFLLGWLLSIQLYVKFTSCLVFAALAVWFLLWTGKREGRGTPGMHWAILAAGLMLGQATHFLCFVDFRDFLVNIGPSWNSWFHGDHHPLNQLRVHAIDAGRTAALLARHFLPLWIAAGLIRWGLTRYREWSRWLLAATAGLYGFQLLAVPLDYGARFFLALAIPVCLVWVNLSGSRQVRESFCRWWGGPHRFPIILLAALPLAGAIGTDTYFTFTLTNHLAAWLVLLLLLLLEILSVASGRRLVEIAAVSLIGLTLFFTAKRALWEPYRINTALFHQNEPVVGVPGLTGLRLDAATKYFFESVYRALRENTAYRVGDPVLGIYNLPGLVYAVGGVSPGAVWYHHIPADWHRNCSGVLSSRRGDRERTVIFLNESSLDSRFLRCLQQAGLPALASYRRVAAVPNPYRNPYLPHPQLPVNILVPPALLTYRDAPP